MEDTLKAAEIERHVRSHDLRHTFAKLLAIKNPAASSGVSKYFGWMYSLIPVTYAASGGVSDPSVE